MPKKRPLAADADASPESLTRELCQRIRTLRRQRGWTLERLSDGSGVSKSMLSQIERGRANPTLGVAYRIAQALGLSLSDLVSGPGVTRRIDVIRRDDRTFIFRSDKQMRIRTLSPLHLEKDVEFYELRLQPGAALRSTAHFDGTRESLTVDKGSLRVLSGDDACELGRGDAAHYPADVPHAIENRGRGEAVVYLVVIYSRG